MDSRGCVVSSNKVSSSTKDKHQRGCESLLEYHGEISVVMDSRPDVGEESLRTGSRFKTSKSVKLEKGDGARESTKDVNDGDT